ncbi:MAG: glycosyltransferase [Ignavibacteriales bacterium]|nr:glycosyltransferase [Ignavibacteriales bacterium]
MKVSALVSIYKAEAFIEERLDDLLAQTLYEKGELEIVVVNSGSPENEHPIIRDYAEAYRDVTYLRTEERETLYRAWNRAARVAKGAYLVNANADDRLRPDAYEILSSALDADPELFLAYADSLVTREPNRRYGDAPIVGALVMPPFSYRQALAAPFAGPSPMWRKAAHEEVGEFDEEFTISGDWEFFIRLAARRKGRKLHRFLSLYCARDEGLELANPQKNRVENQRIHRERRAGVAIEDVYPWLRDADDAEGRAAAWNDLGILYARGTNDLANALRCWQSAIEAGGGAIEAANNVGVGFALLGKIEQARATFAKVAPASETAAENLRALEASASDFGATLKLAAKSDERIKRMPPVWTSGVFFDWTNGVRKREEYLRAEGVVSPKQGSVAVVIPTSDRHDDLRRAVRSAIHQTFPPKEIIVVNDGGADVAPVVSEFNDDRIRVLRFEERRGPSAARNAAIEAATADLIATLDDDDLFYPEHLETLVAAIDEKRRVAYSDAVRAVYRKSKGAWRRRESRVPYAFDFDRELLDVGNYIPTNCLLFDRDAAREAGGYDEAIGALEDWDFLLRLAERTDFIRAALTTTETTWRVRGASITQRKSEEFARARAYVAEKHGERIERARGSGNAEALRRVWARDAADFQPTASIVVPTINRLEYLERFVDSAARHSDRDYELILVDNASDVATAARLREWEREREEIKLVRMEKNTGFPIAVNQGMRRALGKYIVIANNDVILTKNWLGKLVAALDAPDAGIVGPVSNHTSGVQKVNDAPNERGAEIDEFAERLAEKNAGKVLPFPRVVFFLAAMKRETARTLGALDERFTPGNFEDDDYCLRAQLAGLRAYVRADVFVFHDHSMSFLANGAERYRRLLARNIALFKKKWGKTPDDIWLKNETPRRRSISAPMRADELEQRLKWASDLLAEEDAEGAYLHLQNAIEFFEDPASPRMAPTYRFAATLARALGESEAAERYARAANERGGDSADMLELLGDLALGNGRRDEARALYSRARSFDTTNEKLDEKIRRIDDER